MNLEFFSKMNMERCTQWHKGLEWSLSDWVTAVAGELGESANVVKKLNRVRDGVVGNDTEETEKFLRESLADEIADTFIYLDLLASHAGISLGECIVRKFNRTSVKHGFPQMLKGTDDDD